MHQKLPRIIEGSPRMVSTYHIWPIPFMTKEMTWWTELHGSLFWVIKSLSDGHSQKCEHLYRRIHFEISLVRDSIWIYCFHQQIKILWQKFSLFLSTVAGSSHPGHFPLKILNRTGNSPAGIYFLNDKLALEVDGISSLKFVTDNFQLLST